MTVKDVRPTYIFFFPKKIIFNKRQSLILTCRTQRMPFENLYAPQALKFFLVLEPTHIIVVSEQTRVTK